MKSTIKLNSNIRPQEDFFEHVNSIWLKENPIPGSESRWGSFNLLRETASKAVFDIAKDCMKSAKTGNQQRVSDFFTAGLGFDNAVETNLKTLNNTMNEYGNLPIATKLAKLHMIDCDLFWSLQVDLDEKDSTMQVLRFDQSGLTLPNRDYYLEQTDKMIGFRKKYEELYNKLQAKLPALLKGSFEGLLSLETEIAGFSRTESELRDVEHNYNKIAKSKLKNKVGSFGWQEYLEGIDLGHIDQVIINQPDFMSKVLGLLNSNDPRLESYITWHSVLPFISRISEEYSDIMFDFFGKVLSGTAEKKPLWKRVVAQSDSLIGEEIGQMYVKKHFPEDSKKQVLALVEEIRTVYADRIDKLDWMEPSTKAKAQEKLQAMKVLIGYPNKFRDYSELDLTPDNHMQNVINASIFDSNYHLGMVGSKPPKEQWHMNPQLVNAYHDPNRLEIVFPAAILQVPFFGPDESIIENLGGIGAVIGHELTHAFDDQGAQYDAKGNVAPWMTKDERKKFSQLSEPVKVLADEFEVVKGHFMIGDLVLGEAMADLGGLEFSADALQRRIDNNEFQEDGKEVMKRLFYRYAQTESTATREEMSIMLTKTDPHPDSKFRVNSTVAHMASFYDTFEVKESDKMFLAKDKRANIW